MLSAETALCRNPRVVSRSLSDGSGAVLLNLDSTAYHGLNRVGELVWELLEQPLTFEQLVGRIGQAFTAAPAQLEDDIAEFVNDLISRELLLAESGLGP